MHIHQNHQHFLLVFLLSSLSFVITIHPLTSSKNNNGGLFQSPHVFITLGATAGTSGAQWHDTEIELNWYNFEPETGDPLTEDWVGLFNKDPSLSPQDLNPLLAVPMNETSSVRGQFRTPIRFGRPEMTSDNSGDNCLGFWIAFVKNGTLVEVNCFKKYPRWMNDLRSSIGRRPLSELMIPGTHDAGATREYDGGPSENPIVRYSATQEEEFYRQFIHGIRYVDIRVSYYPDTEEKFWINHNVVRFEALVTLFNAVKRFVTETNEIIFMDFREFPVGFEEFGTHDLLLKFIVKEMGAFIVYKSHVPTDPTPEHIWAANRTVILTYENDQVSNGQVYLWPNLIHAWGDKDTVEGLESYFENEALPEYGCKGLWWSAMGEMTPTVGDIILYPLRGLRGFAQMVNIPLTFWWQREEWYSRSMIVSTDFFLGNNIIEMSVWVNQNNKTCPKHS